MVVVEVVGEATTTMSPEAITNGTSCPSTSNTPTRRIGKAVIALSSSFLLASVAYLSHTYYYHGNRTSLQHVASLLRFHAKKMVMTSSSNGTGTPSLEFEVENK